MIIYTVLARSHDGAVLVECSTSGVAGNYQQITLELIQALAKDHYLLPVGNRKNFRHSSSGEAPGSSYNDFQSLMEGIDGFLCGMAQSNDATANDMLPVGYFFHVLHGEGAFYICLSDDDNWKQQSVNFSFLHEVQSEFADKYTPNRIAKANAYGMEKHFSRPLSALMHHYNMNRIDMGGDQKTDSHMAEVEELKTAMGRNISLLLSRGDMLEEHVQRSDELLEKSKIFRKRTSTLKKEMSKRVMMYKAILIGFAILFIYSIFASFCGFTMSKCRSKEDSTAQSE